MKRRYFLQASVVTLGTVGLSRYLPVPSKQQPALTSKLEATKSKLEVTKTEAEWRKILTPEQFNVLRQQGTEPPYSSPLDQQVGKGTYHCAGCNLPLFASNTKFHSGTGWPSFFEPLKDAVRTSEDHSLIATRIEVHCRRCGGHLGHVFDDGPPPTGKRYCMNGVALKFIAG